MVRRERADRGGREHDAAEADVRDLDQLAAEAREPDVDQPRDRGVGRLDVGDLGERGRRRGADERERLREPALGRREERRGSVEELRQLVRQRPVELGRERHGERDVEGLELVARGRAQAELPREERLLRGRVEAREAPLAERAREPRATRRAGRHEHAQARYRVARKERRERAARRAIEPIVVVDEEEALSAAARDRRARRPAERRLARALLACLARVLREDRRDARADARAGLLGGLEERGLAGDAREREQRGAQAAEPDLVAGRRLACDRDDERAVLALGRGDGLEQARLAEAAATPQVAARAAGVGEGAASPCEVGLAPEERPAQRRRRRGGREFARDAIRRGMATSVDGGRTERGGKIDRSARARGVAARTMASAKLSASG